MQPFAVYRGTTDDDGKFVKLRHPGPAPRRYRVDLWVRTSAGDMLRDSITTREKVRLNDLLEGHTQRAVDELIAEAREHGGTEKYGFEMYLWG